MGLLHGGFSDGAPATVQVNGRDLRCLVCGGDTFAQYRAQLNTAVPTFFKSRSGNRSAVCCVCSSCGYIHWFLAEQ